MSETNGGPWPENAVEFKWGYLSILCCLSKLVSQVSQ